MGVSGFCDIVGSSPDLILIHLMTAELPRLRIYLSYPTNLSRYDCFRLDRNRARRTLCRHPSTLEELFELIEVLVQDLAGISTEEFSDETSQNPCWRTIEHANVHSCAAVVDGIEARGAKIPHRRTRQALPFDQCIGNDPGDYSLPRNRNFAGTDQPPQVQIFTQPLYAADVGEGPGIVLRVCPEIEYVREWRVNLNRFFQFKSGAVFRESQCGTQIVRHHAVGQQPCSQHSGRLSCLLSSFQAIEGESHPRCPNQHAFRWAPVQFARLPGMTQWIEIFL